MIEITKKQMNYLIENKYLRIDNKGKIVDLVITGKHKNAKRKKRYVPETYERFLR